MPDDRQVGRVARGRSAAFNRHDLDAIMSHFARGLRVRGASRA